MWHPLLAVAILTLADARDIQSKRVTSGYVALDSFNFNVFFNQFGSTLAYIIGGEYNETKPQAEKLREDIEECKTLITAKQAVCKACAKDACEPGLDDIIVYYLKEAGQPFVDFGNLIGDWSGWDDMSNFFEGAGSGFVSWSGWDDANDFFENIGGSIGSWSGWSDIGNFFENFGLDFADLFTRRKRSLMLKGGRNEKLAYLYRALTKVYSRQSNLSDEARACMEKCDSCSPFLSDTDTMINTICGEELLQLNATYYVTIMKLKLVYGFLTDKTNPLLTSLNYNPTSFDPTVMGYPNVELVAMFSEGYREFKPTEPYRMMQVPTSAALMAKEYWDEV